jgi:hypothetical protein
MTAAGVLHSRPAYPQGKGGHVLAAMLDRSIRYFGVLFWVNVILIDCHKSPCEAAFQTDCGG